MKILLFVTLLLNSLLVSAQDPMQKMLEMQQCIQGIDQAELRQLEQKSRQFQARLQSLCANGSEAKARQEAMAFGTEVMKSKTLAKVRECSKIMEGMLPEIPYADIEADYTDKKVCDSI